MTTQQQSDHKKRLQQKCIAIIDQRIGNSAAAMKDAQAAANEEEKSSAGDKYETARAMSQLEKDMYAKQLAENERELAELLSINCEKIYPVAGKGAFIKCEDFCFFIAAGLGKIMFEGEDVFLLSPNAPIAKILFNKKTGDTFSFNSKEIVIKEVY
jgi:hypothetical protein